MEHIHVSLMTFLITAAQVVLFGFLWRALSYRLAERDSTVGKAMAFIY